MPPLRPSMPRVTPAPPCYTLTLAQRHASPPQPSTLFHLLPSAAWAASTGRIGTDQVALCSPLAPLAHIPLHLSSNLARIDTAAIRQLQRRIRPHQPRPNSQVPPNQNPKPVIVFASDSHMLSASTCAPSPLERGREQMICCNLFRISKYKRFLCFISLRLQVPPWPLAQDTVRSTTRLQSFAPDMHLSQTSYRGNNFSADVA